MDQGLVSRILYIICYILYIIYYILYIIYYILYIIYYILYIIYYILYIIIYILTPLVQETALGVVEDEAWLQRRRCLRRRLSHPRTHRQLALGSPDRTRSHALTNEEAPVST